MSTSGAVTLGSWGFTLYTWPTSGTFAADRVALVGNDSSSLAQVGIGVDGVRVFNPDVSLEDKFNLDGADLANVRYDPQVVTFPVVIHDCTPLEAHQEWRRIQAAVRSRHRRAALEVWDPSTSVQQSRWLTDMIFIGASDLPIEHDQQSHAVGRLQFATLGNPFWTAEPITANYVEESVVLADTSVHQLYVTNPGDEEVWPTLTIATIEADIQIDLFESGLSVVVQRSALTALGNGTVDFDDRTRDPLDNKVTAASLYFPLPPGESRLDINYFNPDGGWSPGGSSGVTVSFLPNYSTC